jgi:hypothetical protein
MFENNYGTLRKIEINGQHEQDARRETVERAGAINRADLRHPASQLQRFSRAERRHKAARKRADAGVFYTPVNQAEKRLAADVVKKLTEIDKKRVSFVCFIFAAIARQVAYQAARGEVNALAFYGRAVVADERP